MANTKQFEHLKIPLEAIISATNNFSDDSCIGKGGFGKVYQGKIDHSKGQQTMVALKRLDRVFGQGDPEFWKEIMMLSFYKHENIVSLLGYCDDCGEKILVYEFASKKSLDSYLNNDELTWVLRLKICLGAARGLAYLHTPADTQLRVVHRDIKSSNILLDENWNAKISDFGLSKFGPANPLFSYVVSNAVGTHGYCDPVYTETGLLTKESDVYSFGVVLFEVLCGRLCFGNKTANLRPLVGLVREYYEENKLNEIIFNNIKDEMNPDSLKVFTEIAYQCLQRECKQRPLMKQVAGALKKALKYQCPDASICGKGTRIVGILNVKVLGGENGDMENHYVILKLEEGSLSSSRKTSVKSKNVNPEWNEEFTLYVQDPTSQHLRIQVHNILTVEMHEFAGFSSLKLCDLTPEEPYIHTSDYHYCRYTFKVVYKPFASYTTFEDVCPVQKAPIGTPEGGGLLIVIIHEGSTPTGKHHTNPYVLFRFRGQIQKTMSMKNNHFPLWEEEFTIKLEEPPKDEEELYLELISTPWKAIFFRKEESMGYVNISLTDVVKIRRTTNKYYLQNGRGFVEVELQWRTVN